MEDEPGVTRDRNYAEVSYEDRPFILIDTGGFEPTSSDRIQQQIREQVEVAIQEADLILFLMDGKEGLNPTDEEVAGVLRKVPKPVFYVVNKIDGVKGDDKFLPHLLGHEGSATVIDAGMGVKTRRNSKAPTSK